MSLGVFKTWRELHDQEKKLFLIKIRFVKQAISTHMFYSGLLEFKY